MRSKIWAIIPAAGKGSRFDNSIPKQYLSLNSKPILIRSIEALRCDARIEKIMVGLAPNDVLFNDICRAKCVDVPTFLGGISRRDTVLNGLISLREKAVDDDWVLVHDAARPLLTQRDLVKLIDLCLSSHIGGILAAPSVDTLKQVGNDGIVTATLDRSCIWRALTPQIFPFGVLLKALEMAKEVSDEAQAVELLGEKVQIIAADDENFKITYKGDLELAEFILNKREGR